MKLIIAGTRTLEVTKEFISEVLKITPLEGDIAEVVSGMAPGMDECGRQWAIKNKIPVKEMAADWKGKSDAAGPIRNKQMAEYADALLLIWDGDSLGSKNMKTQMLKLNKPIYEIILRGHNV